MATYQKLALDGSQEAFGEVGRGEAGEGTPKIRGRHHWNTVNHAGEALVARDGAEGDSDIVEHGETRRLVGTIVEHVQHGERAIACHGVQGGDDLRLGVFVLGVEFGSSGQYGVHGIQAVDVYAAVDAWRLLVSVVLCGCDDAESVEASFKGPEEILLLRRGGACDGAILEGQHPLLRCHRGTGGRDIDAHR